MFQFTFDPVQVPVYALLWAGYKAVCGWVWQDIRQAWAGAYPARNR